MIQTMREARELPVEIDAGQAWAWARVVIDRANQQRIPEVFRARSHVLYYVSNRAGLDVVALRTNDLEPRQLMAILRYRLGQYLAAGLFDPIEVFAQRLEFEPHSTVGPDDVHFMVGCAESGQILAYSTLRRAPCSLSAPTMGDRERPLLPVEHVVGWGVFNRLRNVAELPLSRVCEGGRSVKSRNLKRLDDRAIRAPVELFLAVARTLLGPLRDEIDLVVGMLEEDVAKRNIDFLHVPSVVIHGVIPYLPEPSISRSYLRDHTPFPFAFRVADFEASVPRLVKVESALGLSGQSALAALGQLKKTSATPANSLEPIGGLPTLAGMRVPGQGGSLEARRALVQRGAWLRQTRVLSDLLPNEAAVLATRLDRTEIGIGEPLLRSADASGRIFLIESGAVAIQARDERGRASVVATLGPDEHVDSATLQGSARIAVVATRPTTVLSFARDLALPIPAGRNSGSPIHTYAHIGVESHGIPSGHECFSCVRGSHGGASRNVRASMADDQQLSIRRSGPL